MIWFLGKNKKKNNIISMIISVKKIAVLKDDLYLCVKLFYQNKSDVQSVLFPTCRSPLSWNRQSIIQRQKCHVI